MLSVRYLAAFALAAFASISSAQWTAVTLHSAPLNYSYGYATDGFTQGGSWQNGDNFNAALWSGTPGSFVNLHPAGADISYVKGVSGSQQAGYAFFAGKPRAGIWSGTAASWTSLNPLPTDMSEAHGTDGTKQVGVVIRGDDTKAALWSGTPQSFVDLTPAKTTRAMATAIAGNNQVGYATFNFEDNAGMWSGTKASWVNLHPSGAVYSRAMACTPSMQGGHFWNGSDRHAVIWYGSAASMVILHGEDGMWSEVRGMTNGLQVGTIEVAWEGPLKAVAWEGSAASMIDLHAVLPAKYTSSEASSAASDGSFQYVFGQAYNSDTNKIEAMLWRRPIETPFQFSLNKTTVAGQNSVQGTIAISEPQGTPTVFQTYDNSALVTTPASVAIGAGTTQKNFQITVSAVNSPVNTTIYAKRLGTTKSCPLTLAPLVPTALAFTPNPVIGGQSTSCRVVINGVAGPGGRTIAIFDNSPYSTVPSTVVVPAGATSVTFNIMTLAVTSQKTVTVTARVSAGEKTGTFRINPG